MTARRGQQYSGGGSSPDVVHDIDGVHFEVKRTELLRLHESVAQAKRDAGGSLPIVAHRRNREKWLLIFEADRLMELVGKMNAVTAIMEAKKTTDNM